MTSAATPTPSGTYPVALLESFSGGPCARSFAFEKPVHVIQAHSMEQVIPALEAAQDAANRGLHAAGYVAYEAAPAFDPHLTVYPCDGLPLVWFGIFRKRRALERPVERATGTCRFISPPEMQIAGDEYIGAVEEIRKRIAAGETYQVNFTTRQNFRVEGDQFALYRRMCRNQAAPFCAWLGTGSHHILSTSPELFFALENGRLTMRPMKGTAPRRPEPVADAAERERLAACPKERAENLMIVDLVRNDLSRVAATGSVAVPALFNVETYPTLHQMTSTVTAVLAPGKDIIDIFRALFPCGSVTGAPKRRTMEIIAEQEQGPRGVYCGAIGFISPGGEALFNVAIRTAVIETASGRGHLGVGSGVTWDSDARSEFDECLTKSAFLTREPPDFGLIESLLHDHDGYLLLEHHINRMATSAAHFGIPFSEDALRIRLEQLAATLTGRHKVRVELSPNGELALEAQRLDDRTETAKPLMVTLSSRRLDSTDALRYHKTTRRELYSSELRAHPGCGEVIFLNERGELTEGCTTNIVLKRNGELLTPALSCGLLPGTLRQELLDLGAIREAILTPADLETCETFWLINSVRGWREGKLTHAGG